ncbi:M23 family metallopeptidase [Candidatus Riflebacteria bacterium]
MRKLFLIFLVFSVLVPINSVSTAIPLKYLSSRELIPPLKIPISLSSSFCEYRRGHFHGGLDFRTDGKNGIPIYAVADGYVSRLKVQKRGFGKALYITHPEHGLTSVNAHLSEFKGKNEILKKVAQKALGSKKYGIDLYFKANEYPIKKGELVALSGETGVGFSHLHFELRDTNNNPVNPSCFFFMKKDNKPPVLQNLFIDPKSSDSLINGEPGSRMFSLKYLGKNRYGLKKKVVLSGKFEFSIGLFDRFWDGNHKVGVHKITFDFNEKRRFFSRFENFSFRETGHSHLVYDPVRSALAGLGYVHHLNVAPGNPLEMLTDNPRNFGIIDTAKMSPGIYPLKITASDFNGNISLIENNISVAHKGKLTLSYQPQPVLEWTPPDNKATYNLIISNKKRRKVFKKRIKGTVLLKMEEILTRRKYSNGEFFRIYVNDRNGDLVSESILYNPRFYFKKVKKKYFDVAIELKKDYMVITGSPDRILVNFKLFSNFKSVPFFLQRQKIEKNFTLYTNKEDFLSGHGIIRAQTVNGQVYEAGFKRQISALLPEKNKTFTSKDGALHLFFPKNSVYNKNHFSIKLNQNVRNRQKRLPAVTGLYEFEPYGLPLKKKVVLSYRLKPGEKNAEALGIYRYSMEKNRWYYSGGEVDNGWLKTRIKLLEKFAVLRDNYAPRLELKKFNYKNSVISGVVKVYEIGEGVDENSIDISVGNQSIDFEYDPDWDLLTFKGKYIKPGKNSSLTLTLKDNAGNSCKKLIRRF